MKSTKLVHDIDTTVDLNIVPSKNIKFENLHKLHKIVNFCLHSCILTFFT